MKKIVSLIIVLSLCCGTVSIPTFAASHLQMWGEHFVAVFLEGGSISRVKASTWTNTPGGRLHISLNVKGRRNDGYVQTISRSVQNYEDWLEVELYVPFSNLVSANSTHRADAFGHVKALTIN